MRISAASRPKLSDQGPCEEDTVEFSAPDYVVLIVDDVDRSLAFYTETLGLALDHRSGPFAQLATGRTRVALFQRSAMAETLGREQLPAADPQAPGFELGFKVDDVDAAFADLTGRGVPPIVEPTDRAWGQRTAYLEDPDGYLIELAQDLRSRVT